ncbi:uncharacterized protein Ecym_5614 [Eremothecium cymbalariae DBVPG|uniref:Uncharacterized protein n=1 Tax=Eremothecium cymbalariae (strain CBS 270.75 / DBVPG 7215 / KCTC 17166 / NRRL Y-17582) TaxID=931890 RepID=I6NE58_ERECY|nr:hypothetical protein Ecym_5614 [Eremothecium cymbalariae DBVPG\
MKIYSLAFGHKMTSALMGDSISKQQLISFVGAFTVAFTTGATHIYSIYAPQLLEHCGIPMESAKHLTLAVNVGSLGLGFIGGIITDRKGPQFSCGLGAVANFMAYICMGYCYKNRISSDLPLCVCFAVLSFGNLTAFLATFKWCALNSSNHKGIVLGGSSALHGLASMIYSNLIYRLFGNDTRRIFQFMPIASSALTIIGCFTLKDLNRSDEQKQTGKGSRLIFQDDVFQSTDVHLTSPEQPAAQAMTRDSEEADDSETLKHVSCERTALMSSVNITGESYNSYRLKTSCYQNEVSASYEADLEQAMLSPNSSDITKDPESEFEKEKVWKTFVSYHFISMFIIIGTIQGMATMYTYCIGYIVDVFLASNPDFKVSRRESQSFQVSLISVASCVARFTTGFGSDILVNKFHGQRAWLVFLTCGFIYLAASRVIADTYVLTDISSQLTTSEKYKNLSAGSVLFGLGFGVLFGVLPSLVVELFGAGNFSSMWSIMLTGSLLSVNYFTAMFTDEVSSKTPPDAKYCTSGTQCYAHTFQLIKVCSLLVSLLVPLLIIKQKRLALRMQQHDS